PATDPTTRHHSPPARQPATTVPPHSRGYPFVFWVLPSYTSREPRRAGDIPSNGGRPGWGWGPPSTDSGRRPIACSYEHVSRPAPPAPKRILTWIAIACFATGLVLTAFFVVRIVQTAPRTPQSIEGGVVHPKKEGLTIYASVPVLTPPCEAKDAAGNDVPLKK